VENCSSTVQINLNKCNSINFDGENDYVIFKNNYHLTSSFSLDVWIKPNALTGTHTIISKKDANNIITNGYHFRLVNNIISFNWNDGNTISSPNPITINRWYHVAVTFNGSTYRLYIDGIEVNSTTGTAPLSNTLDCILGAMEQTGNPPNKPVNLF
jgi:predicted methyltransferase